MMRETNSFRVCDPKEAAKILEDDESSIELISIPDAFSKVVEKFRDNKALVQRDEVTKEWKGLTYIEYQEHVEKIAKVFIKLGLDRHGVVAVFAHNCVEWVLSEMAAIHAGGIATGIYTTNSSGATFHILENSRAQICVVGDDEKLKMVMGLKDRLPNLKVIITITTPKVEVEGHLDWSDLLMIDTEEFDNQYKQRLEGISVNDCCIIVYTSGTVGNPKGAMISHDNLLFVAESSFRMFGGGEKGRDVIVSYLPYSHVAAQMGELIGAFLVGVTLYFADKDALKSSLLGTLITAQPTLFFGVPRVFEKFQEKMIAAESQVGFVKKRLAGWAKSVTLQHHKDRISGKSSSSIQFKIAQSLVLNKVKNALGLQRSRVFLTGAAPTTESTREYFLSLDMVLIEGYGMTESSSLHSVGSQDRPTEMKAIKGTRMKIINPDDAGHGEICLQGRHVFMGYLYDEQKTREAIDDDRWLHSGDLGFIDDNDALHITGRIKELIITSGGENIPFVNIENMVKQECSAISNAFLIGDKRRFLSMLITLKTKLHDDGSSSDELDDEVVAWLKTFDLQATKISEILETELNVKLHNEIQSQINRVNKKSASNAQKIQKFSILPKDFAIVTGELTPTMKVKRNYVENQNKQIIDAFYA